ncbi:MAG: filamentous hemagglutinin N-terminal domain-containing protein, partial [Candidatus Ratteibacteria bacterium]
MKGVRNNLFAQLAALISCAVLMWPIQALPMPTGGNVVAGQATISQPGATTMQIDQASQKAIINWQGYSINANELVRYIQPGASAIVLNRVIGGDPSRIYGQIQANGQVFVINNAGILVGSGAKIDVGSFLASTLNISDSDFLAGKYNFIQDSEKSPSYIVNKGTITVSDEGYVILAAPLVSNEGLIIANLGKVNLIGGEKVTVNFDGTGLINFTVDKLSGQPGTILMTKEAASDIIKNVVNTQGLVEAGQVIEKDGVIELAGASGIVINSGTIKAQGGSAILKATQASVLSQQGKVDAKGGTFELSGNNFLLAGTVDAKTILIDPANILIAEGSGSDPNTVYEDWIEAQLNSNTDVLIQAYNSITMLNFTTTGDEGIDATGTGNLTLQITNEDLDGSGTITFSDQNDHISIAGNITLDAQTYAATNGSLQNIGKLTTTSGSINLLASKNIELLNNVQVGGSGVITINSTGGTVTQGANSYISSSNTGISITASNYSMVGGTLSSNGAG